MNHFHNSEPLDLQRLPSQTPYPLLSTGPDFSLSVGSLVHTLSLVSYSEFSVISITLRPKNPVVGNQYRMLWGTMNRQKEQWVWRDQGRLRMVWVWGLGRWARRMREVIVWDSDAENCHHGNVASLGNEKVRGRYGNGWDSDGIIGGEARNLKYTMLRGSSLWWLKYPQGKRQDCWRGRQSSKTSLLKVVQQQLYCLGAPPVSCSESQVPLQKHWIRIWLHKILLDTPVFVEMWEELN